MTGEGLGILWIIINEFNEPEPDDTEEPAILSLVAVNLLPLQGGLARSIKW